MKWIARTSSRILFLAFALTCAFSFSLEHAVADISWGFSQSKKIAKELYKQNKRSFYCNCQIVYEGARLSPDVKDCGYVPRNKKTKTGKPNSRAERIEWEHIVPASLFGKTLKCWAEGGRKACRKDPSFKAMEADLHNLVPAIGEINGDRSNFIFSEIMGEERVYGNCDFEINFPKRLVEPRIGVRGDIARAYFYMSEQYGLDLTLEQLELFETWAEQDPPDKFEKAKNLEIKKIQGVGNRFISEDVKKSSPIIRSRELSIEGGLSESAENPTGPSGSVTTLDDL